MNGFLFGKLPGFGDFVARGLSPPLRAWWDEWATATLQGAPRGGGMDFDPYDPAAPARRFAVEIVAGRCWQIGCVAASHDRVGRVFPFVLGVSLGRPIGPAASAAIGERIAALLLEPLSGPRVELDAYVAAAVTAASDPLQARHPALPIALYEECGDRAPLGGEL